MKQPTSNAQAPFSFSSLKTFWIETWRESKVLFFAEMLGAILGISAATYLAIAVKNPNMFIVLLPWGISALLMCYVAYKRRSAWLMIVMAFYSVNNFYGLFALLI